MAGHLQQAVGLTVMGLGHHLRYALRLTPRAALTKGGRWLARLARGRWDTLVLSHRNPYPTDIVAAANAPLLLSGSSIDDIPGPLKDTLAKMATHWRAHRFDLLGSGWVPVVQDTPPALPSGARAYAGDMARLLPASYKRIDWQLDFKSGHRWPGHKASRSQTYGHRLGIDVKVPWELARLQHLPPLALDGDHTDEIRNQILDFLSANPPGFGVNWMCTMDVAIRAANIVLATALTAANGHTFDDAFNAALRAGLISHGRFVFANLENRGNHLGNHYLANVAGLAFIAAALPKGTETDAWLNFARNEIEAQTSAQFGADGANFEASTSYHRLSAEMVAYATAVLMGVTKARGLAPLPPSHFERLERMAEFSIHITKPTGRVVQIGDNDSGRFFKLAPLLVGGTEDHLNHRTTVGAINGFFHRADFAAFAGAEGGFEGRIIEALARSTVPSAPAPVRRVASLNTPPPPGRTYEIKVANGVLDGVIIHAYPDFGLYIWRGPRFFLSVRCGAIGQNGNGGHAHNDQLSIELTIDDEDWLRDPGSYLYTADTDARDAYRSVMAHATPRAGSDEPSRLDLGLFSLENNANAQCHRFDENEFLGVHMAYGFPVTRHIVVGTDTIRITDQPGETETQTMTNAAETREAIGGNVPFSPGYGLREDK